ncbi:hypothetical protein KAR26_02680 [Candidatus Parcubacteria bacterium]|nr:hypothetical protein [Candidatus Parcubacteria bacterium]
MNEISKNALYLNTINRNLHNIDKKETEKFFGIFKEADCIIRVGQGRSRAACDLGLCGIRKRIVTRDNLDFPGNNIGEGLTALRREYKNIVILIVSSSGETKTPKYLAEDVASYLRRTGTAKIKIIAITSRPDSTVGKIARKYGVMLKLEGPKSEAKTSKIAAKAGIMNDIFELPVMLFIHKMKEAVNRNKKLSWVQQQIYLEMENIGKIVDQFVQTKYYDKLVSKLLTRAHITVGGYGPAELAASMLVIRLRHIKKKMKDSAHKSGSDAPRPRLYDILLTISFTGETRAVIDWTNDYTFNFSITGNNSSLSGKTENFLLNEPIEKFYVITSFLLSPIPLRLVEVSGIGLESVKSEHSSTE